MIWHFYIVDRNGLEQAVDNPVGWDGTSFELKRDEERHGIMFEYQGNEYEYHGKAAQLLKDEYDVYGIEGKMQLRITLDSGNGEEELGLFKFLFEDWQDCFGTDWNVKIPVEENSGLMDIKNRMEQKVDLRTATSFGGVSLPLYSKLPFTATLPSKSIYVEDYSKRENDLTDTYQPGFTDTTNNESFAFFHPTFDKEISAEIGYYEQPVAITAAFDEQRPLGFWSPPNGWTPLGYNGVSGFSNSAMVVLDMLQPVISYGIEAAPETYYGDGVNLNLQIDFEGEIHRRFSNGSPVTQGLFAWCFYLCKRDKNNYTNWYSNYNNSGNWAAIQGDLYAPVFVADKTYSNSWSENVTLNDGDRIYYFFMIGYGRNSGHKSEAPFDITYKAGCSFRLSGLSSAPPTDSKLFAVNEALSRVTEAITDDRVRAYSKYFGRTDSQPYNANTDGCGGLEAITTGLFIRRMEDKLPTRPPIFSMSLKDLWEGLNPIHNLGMGIEPDDNRPGYYLLRIEPWNYFYQPQILLACPSVAKLERRILSTKHYGIFRFGYNKWEAEQYNGIDEFLSSREYRTELSQYTQTLEKKSSMIASGFALEVTRRKGNDYAEDWRYDNDTFIICMKRSGFAGSPMIPEVGNIDTNTVQNILDPPTIYNWRIRPLYNAMRWMPAIINSYRHVGNGSKMIFTSGDGNVYARGTMTGNFCIPCSQLLSEKDTIVPGNLVNPADGKPLFHNEEIVFDYPMNLAQYKNIRNNPHGLIQYSTDGISGYGWVRKITYKPAQGMATFTLIPKR